MYDFDPFSVAVVVAVVAKKSLLLQMVYFQPHKVSTTPKILSTVQELNADESIHGIIVQLPLECNNPVDASLAINAVAVEKDVDG